MEVRFEWANYKYLLNVEAFLITAKIWNIEQYIWNKTGIVLGNCLHSTRRFEYPWCILNAYSKELLDFGVKNNVHSEFVSSIISNLKTV